MQYYLRAITLVIVMSYLCLEVSAMKQESLPPAGLWRQATGKHACQQDCQQRLVQDLARLTGWQSWQFTEAGQLIVSEPSLFVEGSATARQWFEQVWQRPDVFFIEDHSGSNAVNFGQLNEGLTYSDDQTGRRCSVWRVRLDFEDFRKLQAPRVVKATFDAGFTFLHELLHGLGYRDAHSFDDVGQCEAVVNDARRELGLPVRARYFAETLTPMRYALAARLLFHRVTPQGKTRNEWLFFIPGCETISDLPTETTAAVTTRRRQ